MVEEQVYEELAVTARDRHLGADEREAGAELAQEPGEVVGQGLGQVALPDRVGGEEVEDERVLDDVPHRFPVGLGDRVVEGGERGVRSLVQSAGNHRLQHAAGPSLVNGALGVELRGLPVRAAVEQGRHQAPGQLCNAALHNCGWPAGGERRHVAQVTDRQSAHVRVRRPQVRGQALDHLGAPALLVLPRDDVAADLPVGLDEDVVDGPGRAQLPGREGLLDGVEQLVVLGGGSD